VHFYAVDGAGNKAAPLMTLERPGCLSAKPCVGRGPCGPCLDEMKLHQVILRRGLAVLRGVQAYPMRIARWEGQHPAEPGMPDLPQGYVEGDVGDIPEQMVMGSAKVPSMAGGFTPSLEIFDKGNESLGMFEATGTVRCPASLPLAIPHAESSSRWGRSNRQDLELTLVCLQCPCLFGGMSEMCCDQNYSINGPSGEVHAHMVTRALILRWSLAGSNAIFQALDHVMPVCMTPPRSLGRKNCQEEAG